MKVKDMPEGTILWNGYNILGIKGNTLEEKYINKILNFADENICSAKELVINKEQTIEKLKAIVTIFKFAENHGWFPAIKTKQIREDYIVLVHILNLIEKLQKENEKLKSKNKTLYELYKYYKEVAGSYQGNYIPVQKVKDKIEEYKKMLLSCNRFSDVDRIKAINEKILELQELLEEKGE